MDSVNSFNNNFYNPETEINTNYDNEIHIHRQSRNVRKCKTIIQGLVFKTKEENKLFISKISKKFGIGGCQKMMDDIDKDKIVFVFDGDCRDKVKDILILEYGKDEDYIKYHG